MNAIHLSLSLSFVLLFAGPVVLQLERSLPESRGAIVRSLPHRGIRAVCNMSLSET